LLAEVELQSEDPCHPIEAAWLLPQSGGWRAAGAGPQTIRLLFHKPLNLRRILLHFEEKEHQRTQEFVLRRRGDEESDWHEVVRQQWNFSPSGNVSETEDYQVDLFGVKALELQIIPDISRGEARATLKQWRIA